MIITYTVFKKNMYIYTIFLWFITKMPIFCVFFLFFIDCLKIDGKKIFAKHFL